jgi:spermidine synthase
MSISRDSKSTGTPSHQGGAPSTPAFLAVLLFFLVSGGSGLLYQVVWTRRLVLLFGATSYAVSTVLAIFFLGLAIGSWLGGRLADRSQRTLIVYGVFEILIAGWAVLFLLTIGRAETFAVELLRDVAQWRPAAIGIRAILATAMLIVPVSLMGATLPLLARFVAASGSRAGWRVGVLYGWNTLGAVVGCAVTGYYLLPEFGYTGATWIGAAGNAAVGLLAIAMARNASQQPTPTADVAPDDAHDRSRSFVIAAFTVSGFCALALEVFWTRLLAVVFVGTTYAFTTMLVAILCGIGAGSLAAAPIADRVRNPVLLLGLLQALIGAACFWTLSIFAGLPVNLAEWQTQWGWDWDGVMRATVFASFMTLFLPTFLFGAAFPLVVRSVSHRATGVGGSVGRAYSANTIGGVFGAIAAGYVLLPLAGTQNGILFASLLLVVSGLALIVKSPGPRIIGKLVAMTIAVVVSVGAYTAVPSDVSRAVNHAHIPAHHEVLMDHEGIEGTVVVSGPAADTGHYDRILWINAIQATQSIEKGVKMNRFQGVLPMLFDREPETALFMCFGSGVTAGTLAQTSLSRIDAVEIAPDVLKAAPFFSEVNYNVIENPKMNFIIDDGRNYLLTSQAEYDVITFEPMPLALAGVSTFYTEEYYRLCRERLAPRGLVSQWVPMHSLNPDIVQSLVATFAASFSEYCAWFVNADLFLIGSDEPLAISYSHAQAVLDDPVLGPALREVGIPDATELIASFVMGREAVRAFGGNAPPMSDDRPWAEFEAPKWVNERTVQDTIALLRERFESPISLLDTDDMAEDVANEARTRIQRRFEARRHDLEGLQQFYGGSRLNRTDLPFKAALDADPGDATARYYLRQIVLQRVPLFAAWQEFDEGLVYIEEMLPYLPEFPELFLYQGDLYYELKEDERASVSYAKYLDLGGNDPRAEARIPGSPSNETPSR